jgi:cytochrome c oxidase subunit II
MYQSIAWYVTLFLVFLLTLAFAIVYGESRRLREYGPIQEKGYKIRKFYFLGLLAVMGFASAMSLSKLPYHNQHAAAKAMVLPLLQLQQQWSSLRILLPFLRVLLF